HRRAVLLRELPRQRLIGQQEALRALAQRLARVEKAVEVGRGRQAITSGQAKASHHRGASYELAPTGKDEAHFAFSGFTTYQPVTMDGFSFQAPATNTSKMCTRKNRTRKSAVRKCSVRADCRPPKRSRRYGVIASKPGDMVSPVSTIIGIRKKITAI